MVMYNFVRLMIIKNGQKPDIGDIVRLAEEAGFTYAAPLAMDALIFRPEVRDMCSSDRCHSYGRSWSCPPAAGSLERAEALVSSYKRGVIVQTVGETGSGFDLTAVNEIMQKHSRCFDTLVRQLKLFFPDCMPMGAGACRLCRSCTYPDRPCRHPDRMYPSMEAYGLLVSDVAVRSGLGYNYGENTMSFTSCVLTD